MLVIFYEKYPIREILTLTKQLSYLQQNNGDFNTYQVVILFLAK